MKYCDLPEEEKQIRRERCHQWYLKNKAYVKAKTKERYHKFPKRHGYWQRNTVLKTKYGLTRQDYDRLFNEQDGRCKICERTSNTTLHVDHCHTTNIVRGLLCGSCNRALGLFQDDPEILQRAMNYALHTS